MPDKKVPTSRAGTSASAAKHRDYTATLSVDQSPDVAYAAILNVRGWRSGDIEGRTDQVGEEWTYRYEDIHYSKQRVTELVPGKKVVWLVLDSRLSFVKDQSEWNGTRVVFDVARQGAKTEVTFTHVGLDPEQECFNACSDAWGSYIRGSLRSLIATGKGEPNEKR
jgi:hypothetical protein